MLLLHNNHVSKIQEHLAEAIANLEFLMLTGNRIAQLAEVDHLVGFAKLDTLSLSGNPVTKRKYYREYVIHKLPQLHVLDFQRIRPRVGSFCGVMLLFTLVPRWKQLYSCVVSLS